MNDYQKLDKILSNIKDKLPDTHWDFKKGQYVFESFSIPFDRTIEYYFEKFDFIYDELKEFLQKGYIEKHTKDEKNTIDEFRKDLYQEYRSRIFKEQSQEFCYGKEKELSKLFLELVDLCDKAISLYHKIIQENTMK